jgi:sulfoxide reductase heme-binding subunit YedZ
VTTLGTSGPTALWYLARGTGIVSLILLTVSVALGIVTTIRWSSDRWPRFSISFIHRNVSLLAVAFLVVHIGANVIDGFALIGWKDAVVPFVSAYRPLWLGLGALAFDLLLALSITSLLRNRIGQRTWRAIHWLAYACWPVAVLHGLGTGTDTPTRVVLVVNAACVGLVVACVWWRVAAGWPRDGAVRGTALAASLLAPFALVAWLASGPLASGWAREAGTPQQLLGGQASASTESSASGAIPTTNPPSATSPSLGSSFAAAFTGTVRQSVATNGIVTLDMSTTLRDGATGSLTVALRGRSNSNGGLLVQDGTVTVSSATGQDLFDGQVADIRGNTIMSSPTTGSPSSASLVIRFDTLDVPGGRVAGSLQATTGR